MVRSRSAGGLVLLLLSLSCAVAFGAPAGDLTFRVSDNEQEYLNQLHAPENAEQLEAMRSIFLELDVNADGALDSEELAQHVAAGTLSDAEHTLMQAFDDGDGSINEAEMMMAPYMLNMLETAVDVERTDVLRRVGAVSIVNDEMAAAEAAFEGDEPATHMRLKSRAAAAPATVLSEVSSYASPKSTGLRVKKPSKRGNAPLPVSLFGVPSVSDEECVMCLYFVQRIQAGVADRLTNKPAAKATGPAAAQFGAAGLPGATAAAQQSLKIRNTNSQLAKKAGGRGIVRVVAEDMIQALCAVDRMPLLFAPYCNALVEANAINAVRKGIFFNIPTSEVCQQAQLCRDDSYLNTNAAVHSTKTSLFLNGQRGICGMLGGAKDRTNSRDNQLINAICAAHGAVFTPKI